MEASRRVAALKATSSATMHFTSLADPSADKTKNKKNTNKGEENPTANKQQNHQVEEEGEEKKKREEDTLQKKKEELDLEEKRRSEGGGGILSPQKKLPGNALLMISKLKSKMAAKTKVADKMLFSKGRMLCVGQQVKKKKKHTHTHTYTHIYRVTPVCLFNVFLEVVDCLGFTYYSTNSLSLSFFDAWFLSNF
jgi:hypothetical protein